MNTWKQELWEKCSIGVPHLDIEANDSVIFGYLVCWFITEVSIIISGVNNSTSHHGESVFSTITTHIPDNHK